MNDYTIITADTIEELSDKVNNMVNKGYVPMGGITAIPPVGLQNTHLAQAIFLDGTTIENEIQKLNTRKWQEEILEDIRRANSQLDQSQEKKEEAKNAWA